MTEQQGESATPQGDEASTPPAYKPVVRADPFGGYLVKETQVSSSFGVPFSPNSARTGGGAPAEATAAAPKSSSPFGAYDPRIRHDDLESATGRWADISAAAASASATPTNSSDGPLGRYGAAVMSGSTLSTVLPESIPLTASRAIAVGQEEATAAIQERVSDTVSPGSFPTNHEELRKLATMLSGVSASKRAEVLSATIGSSPAAAPYVAAAESMAERIDPFVQGTERPFGSVAATLGPPESLFDPNSLGGASLSSGRTRAQNTRATKTALNTGKRKGGRTGSTIMGLFILGVIAVFVINFISGIVNDSNSGSSTFEPSDSADSGWSGSADEPNWLDYPGYVANDSDEIIDALSEEDQLIRNAETLRYIQDIALVETSSPWVQTTAEERTVGQLNVYGGVGLVNSWKSGIWAVNGFPTEDGSRWNAFVEIAETLKDLGYTVSVENDPASGVYDAESLVGMFGGETIEDQAVWEIVATDTEASFTTVNVRMYDPSNDPTGGSSLSFQPKSGGSFAGQYVLEVVTTSGDLLPDVNRATFIEKADQYYGRTPPSQ